MSRIHHKGVHSLVIRKIVRRRIDEMALRWLSCITGIFSTLFFCFPFDLLKACDFTKIPMNEAQCLINNN